MIHSEIDDRQFPERYVLDRLTDAERELFETHLVDCRECQDAVRAAGALAGGLRSVRHEFPAAAPVRTPFWARPIVLWQGFALAAACLLAALIPAGVWYNQAARSRAEAAAALANADRATQAADSLRAQLNAPSQAMPVFPLELSRGAGDESLPEIPVSPAAGGVVLVGPGDAARDASTAELHDASGRSIWTAALSARFSDSLGLTAPAKVLTPGRYELVLLGGGQVRAHFAFRATAGK